MDLFLHIPTQLFMGEGAVSANAQKLAELGKRALVVAGKSADANGAMRDVAAALEQNGVAYTRVYGARPNPELDDIDAMVQAGRGFAADFVVAIGGGSPIDAAKIAAVLLAQGLNAHELVSAKLADAALPIAAIPTTSGTGTEANSYAVVTLHDPKRKQSYALPSMAPRIGLLDPRYTYSLNSMQSASTAVDVLAHLIEGYLREGWTLVGEMLALEGLSRFAKCKEALLTKNYDAEARYNLQYASMLGGVILAHAKTIAPHLMGYALTNFRDMPHGQACGVLMAAFMKKARAGCDERVEKTLRALDMASLDEFKGFIERVLPPHGEYTMEELERYADISLAGMAAKPNPVAMDRKMLLDIYAESLIEN